MSGSISSKLVSGAFWMVLLNTIERGLGMISIFILARMLLPADFGVVAMATSFVFLVQLFTSFGFDIALIHNRDANKQHFNTAWTLSLLLGLSLAAIILLAAQPVAVFYKKPEVFWVMCALSVLPLVGCLENIGVVAFRKDLDFRREFTFQISRKLVGFLTTVPLAFLLKNYWAIVLGMLAARTSGTVTSYFVHPYRPRLTLVKARELLGFSRWLLLNNGITFLNERLTDIVIGRTAGPAALGTYNVVFEFSYLPKTEIASPVNRALLPGFAKVADLNSVRHMYLKATAILALIALPAAIGLSAIAPVFIPVALGNKWLAGVSVMEVLAFSGALLMFQTTIGSLLISRGMANTTMKLNFGYLVIVAPLSYWLVRNFGIEGAAWSALVASSAMSLAYFAVLKKTLGVTVADLFHSTARPIASSVVMYFSVRGLISLVGVGNSFPQKAMLLASSIVLGIVTFYTTTFLLWHFSGKPDSGERTLIDQIRNRIRLR
jgi:O-antigen/teichoic acid export membrane protein